MAQGAIRRRAAKLAALALATLLTAILTMVLARIATYTIVNLDAGSVSQTVANNLTASDADLRRITTGAEPGGEFKATISRAIASKTITGYRLFGPNGSLRFENSILSSEHASFDSAVRAAASSKTLVTRSDWAHKGNEDFYISYAFIPVVYNGATVAVQGILLDQTDRWNKYFQRLLVLMWIASCIAVASIGIPALFWYKKNRELIYHEAEKRDMLARFKSVFDNMPQGVTLFDKDARLVVANEQYIKFYRLKPEAVKTGTSLQALRDHRLECGAPVTHLDIYDRPDPAIEFGEQRAKRWHINDGRILETQRYPVSGGGWVTMHTDVTNRVAREKELQGAHNFVTSVIEHMPGAVLVKKPDTLEYVLINKRAEQTIGAVAETIVGKRTSDLFEPQQAKVIIRRDLAALSDPNNDVHDHEEAVRTPGRGERKIATKRIVLRDNSNNPVYLITMIEDVTDQRKAEEKVRYLATYDTLTGLFNRAHFNEVIEREMKPAANRSEIALLLIDLDGFKEVNDTFGHPAGDEVLRVTAARLRNVFCDIDTIARLGGDEFAVICRSASCQLDLQTLAARIVADLQQSIDYDDRQIRVGATVGIAIADENAADAQTLMRFADLAMYDAKENGKGNYCFFDLGMMIKRLHQKQLVSDMVFAIDRNEFELHYQPIVDPRTNTVRSMEALLRWRHHERGMISPAEFIPIAEETGLIVAIGEHVLEMACKAAMAWTDDIRISVNLSPIQFRDQNLANKVMAILKRTGLSPSRLELEITEAALLQENEGNLKVLKELRATGVRIVMDDFGTGYSSLNYLRSFPFDKIKIDRSYIKDLVSRDGNSLTIVNAVLALAAGLSLSTTAEGVETKEQLDILNAAGCDEIQGFYYSKPLPAADVPGLLQRLHPATKRAA